MRHALKVWRHYLLGKFFFIVTNHNSLTNFLKEPNLNAHQARWNVFMSESDFENKHLKGKDN